MRGKLKFYNGTNIAEDLGLNLASEKKVSNLVAELWADSPPTGHIAEYLVKLWNHDLTDAECLFAEYIFIRLILKTSNLSSSQEVILK